MKHSRFDLYSICYASAARLPGQLGAGEVLESWAFIAFFVTELTENLTCRLSLCFDCYGATGYPFLISLQCSV